MSDLVPALAPVPARSGPAGPAMLQQLRAFAGQPAFRRALPWFGGVAGLGVLALAWAALSPAPQRTLYGQLDDGQRADVVAALDKAAIPYTIDNDTGALSVNEEDLYRARMTIASNGALASPESGMDLLDKLPLGASRTMEGERLRAARERELMLTIGEIDGVEAVRVHLAEPQQSVFVRDSAPPSASVMLRLTGGRQLSADQVVAIANLVANSVTGLSVDDVRIVDQHGRLLSQQGGKDTTALDLQARMEEKLRAQVGQLLTPVLGPGNFSSEIQVELDMEERTAARESYDKNGVVRQETQQSSTSQAASGGSGAVGVPGVLSNTPPPPATAQQGAPQGTPVPTAGAGSGGGTQGETRASRTYELGREVAVSNLAPGRVKRISVAVALSAEVMKKGKASDVDKIKALVGAAVGADPARGDQVAVVVRGFEDAAFEATPFYETGWFASLVRNGVTLIGLVLVLLLVVRPLMRALKGAAAPAADPAEDRLSSSDDTEPARHDAIDRSLLNRQIGAAQKLVDERPDRAVIALRQMLGQKPGGAS